MNIVLFLVAITMQSMPAWIIVFNNPRWPQNLRRTILVSLATLATIYYIILLLILNPELFSDAPTLYCSISILAINWMITIYRTYLLWPRKKQ